MSTKVGDIFVRANLDDRQYKKDLNGLEQISSKAGATITKALAVTAVIGGLVNLTKKASTLGDTVDKMSQKLGMSNKAYQEWDYIMQRNGASIDSMTTAMKTLASSVETGKDALKALGISQEEAMGMSQEQLFERVVTALQGVTDTTKRTYLATQLLGRGATDLGAVLNLSAQDMAYLKSNLESLGGVMSDKAVKNSAQFKDAITDLHMAFRGLADILATYVLPILTTIINKIIIPAVKILTAVMRTLFGWIAKFLSLFKIFDGALNKTFGEDTQDMLGDTGVAFSDIGGNIGKVGNTAKKSKKEVQALKRELMGFDRIIKLTKQDEATGTTGGGGVGSGGGSIGGIDPSTISDLTIPSSVTDSWDGLGNIAKKALETILDIGKTVLDDVISPLLGAITKHVIPTAFDTLGTALQNIVDTATSFPKWLGDLLTSGNKKVKIECDDQFTKVWDEIKKKGDVTVGVSLVRDFGSNNKTVADWLVNSGYIGQAKAYIGLDRGFVGTVADWLKNNNFIGNLVSPIFLSAGFVAEGFATVADWLVKHSLMGLCISTIQLQAGFVSEGFKTVADWIAGKGLKGIVQMPVTLLEKFSDAYHTVSDWIVGLFWGKGIKKAIGLEKDFGNKVSTVAEWLQKFHWGGATKKKIGLTRNFMYGGKSYKTVSEWIKAQIGTGVTATVNIVPQATTNKKKKGVQTAGGGVYHNGKWSPVQRYATGGMPNGSQLFWAREAGAELVGTIGGHTAVMNNDQIVASVSSGVAKAIAGIRFKLNAPALANSSSSTYTGADNSEMIALLKALINAVQSLDLDVELDGEKIKNNTVRRINQNTMSTGKLELVI